MLELKKKLKKNNSINIVKNFSWFADSVDMNKFWLLIHWFFSLKNLVKQTSFNSFFLNKSWLSRSITRVLSRIYSWIMFYNHGSKKAQEYFFNSFSISRLNQTIFSDDFWRKSWKTLIVKHVDLKLKRLTRSSKRVL